MEKNMENLITNWGYIVLTVGIQDSIWGYYGTHCRVRFYPPFGV